MNQRDQADYDLLSMANERGKFGLDIQGIDDVNLQYALERGIDEDWFTLVDVSFVANMPGVLMRVFKLTPLGRQRLNLLKEVDGVQM